MFMCIMWAARQFDHSPRDTLIDNGKYCSGSEIFTLMAALAKCALELNFLYILV